VASWKQNALTADDPKRTLRETLIAAQPPTAADHVRSLSRLLSRAAQVPEARKRAACYGKRRTARQQGAFTTPDDRNA
jgi:hypothetical protein